MTMQIKKQNPTNTVAQLKRSLDALNAVLTRPDVRPVDIALRDRAARRLREAIDQE